MISVAGSLLAAASAGWNRRRSEAEWRPVRRLVEIADAAPGVDRAALAVLEDEYRAIVSAMLGCSSGTVSTDCLSAFSTALAHARHALDRRRASLEPGTVASPPAPTLVVAR